ncbi:MAG: DUF933 domain-containing protein [Caldilineaceae bacterium]
MPVARSPERESDAFHTLNQEMRFLSAKPVIYVANVDEADLGADNACVTTVRAIAAEQGAEVVVLCARLEADMVGMDPAERTEYLELAGVAASGLDQVIRHSYHLLGLISYFTTDSRMLRAWTIHRGMTAPQAAGVIHTDFERGFIRAEVVHWPDFDALGSEHAAKNAGLLHVEGRDYVVQDGDVIHFRFNV